MSGTRGYNAISHLAKLSPAGYGGKLTDGPPSQLGSTSRHNVGYSGDITPLLELFKDVKRKPRIITNPYIASADVSYHPYVSSITNEGERLSDKEIVLDDLRPLLPPNQIHSRSKQKQTKPIASLAPNSAESYWKTVDVQNETPRDIHRNKYGDDDDPNPISGLPTLDPVAQQGYQPDQLDPSEVWTNRNYAWTGNYTQIGKDRAFEAGKKQYHVKPGQSTDSKKLLTTSVQNYLWSTASNRAVLKGHRFHPTTGRVIKDMSDTPAPSQYGTDIDQ